MRYSTTKESYSEVFEIINLLGEEYKNKIPKELYKFLEKNRDRKYVAKFKKIDNLNYNSISKKAIAIIAFLNQKYWNEDDNQKEKLEKIYPEEQKRFRKEVLENYDNELLCNSKPYLDTEENCLPVLDKEGLIRKVKAKICNIICKLLKKNA